MKNVLRLLPVISLFVILTLPSCVSKGKYLLSEGRGNRLQRDSSETHGLLNTCNSNLAGVQNDKRSLEAQIASLKSQSSNLQSDLQNANEAGNKSKLTIEQQAKRLKDLQDLIQAQRDVMTKLRKSVADALVNFKPDELSVYIKDGNVYVSLEEKLLFKSGSAAVDPKGKDALGKLASVLNNTSDITVQIEGHTDTIPIHTERFEDNWALSVGRAASIVRILTKDYGVDAHRIVASGKGEFHPVKSNETSESRASNRRTEIILSPNLSELYKLLALGQ